MTGSDTRNTAAAQCACQHVFVQVRQILEDRDFGLPADEVELSLHAMCALQCTCRAFRAQLDAILLCTSFYAITISLFLHVTAKQGRK